MVSFPNSCSNVKLKAFANWTEDVIREFQGKKLREKHAMMPLPVFRDKISTSFNHEVMAT